MAHSEELNAFLVGAFNEVLKSEEESMLRSCEGLSLREIHLIDEVCSALDEGRDNRATAVAETMRVTAGTLTAAVSLLEKKGYLVRERDARDRRVVRILPTARGYAVRDKHAEYHRWMVGCLMEVLSDGEAEVLARALSKLTDFFKKEQLT